MRGCRDRSTLPISSIDTTLKDLADARQGLQLIRFHADFHNRFQSLLCRFDMDFQKIQRPQLLLDRFARLVALAPSLSYGRWNDTR